LRIFPKFSLDAYFSLLSGKCPQNFPSLQIPKIKYVFCRFAQLASNVFIKNRICVTLFSECVPTPVVSFAVVELNCDAGLMVLFFKQISEKIFLGKFFF